MCIMFRDISEQGLFLCLTFQKREKYIYSYKAYLCMKVYVYMKKKHIYTGLLCIFIFVCFPRNLTYPHVNQQDRYIC